MSESWEGYEIDKIGEIFCAHNTNANYAASTTSTAGMPQSMDEAMQMMAEAKRAFDILRRKELRAVADWEKIKCPRCLRSPTLTNDGCGDTIEMCYTIYQKLRSDPQFKSEDFHPMNPMGYRLSGYECDSRPKL